MTNLFMKISQKNIGIVSVTINPTRHDKINLIIKGIYIDNKKSEFSLEENGITFDINIERHLHCLMLNTFKPLDIKFKKMPDIINTIMSENKYELRMINSYYINFRCYLRYLKGMNKEKAEYVIKMIDLKDQKTKKLWYKRDHDLLSEYECRFFKRLITFDEVYSFIHKHNDHF